MVLLDALRETPRALQRNPVVFVPVFVIMVFQLPQLVLQTIHPLLASVVSLALSLVFIVVTPFFQAGIVGMADEALDGRTSLSTFVADGKSHYVSVLLAYLLVVGVNFVLGIVVFFVAIAGGFALMSGDLGAVGWGVVAFLGLVVLVAFLAYLLFLFFVQFYGQAIVVDDYSAFDGLKHSVGVVRQNLLKTLGYSVLVGVLGGVAGFGFGLVSVLTSPRSTELAALPSLSIVASVGVAVVVVILGTLFGGFFGVFSVAFYRRISE